MFEGNILVRGKHASYLKALSAKTELLNKDYKGIAVFDRNIDVFMIAPIFGVIYNKRAPEDSTIKDTSNILFEQIAREKLNVEYVFRMVMLADKSKNRTPDEKIKLTFREKGDMDLFFSYLRGGIEYLYEFFTENATTKDDYYEKLVELVGNINDETVGNFAEKLKKL